MSSNMLIYSLVNIKMVESQLMLFTASIGIFSFWTFLWGTFFKICNVIKPSPKHYEVSGGKYDDAWCAIVFGGIISTIMLYGYLGVIKKKRSMIKMHIITMILLLVLELLACMNVRKNQKHLEEIFKDVGTPIFDLYYTDMNAQLAVDNLQYELSCCGIEGPQYWNDNELPPTCCNTSSTNCYKADAFRKGCLPEIIKKTEQLIPCICTTLVVAMLLEVLYIACSLKLLKKLESKNRRGNMQIRND